MEFLISYFLRLGAGRRQAERRRSPAASKQVFLLIIGANEILGRRFSQGRLGSTMI